MVRKYSPSTISRNRFNIAEGLKKKAKQTVLVSLWAITIIHGAWLFDV
jgi:hypothetical protein